MFSFLKKLIVSTMVVTLTIIGIIMPSEVFADSQDDENFISQEEFNELKANGVYGEEITYEDLINSINLYQNEDYTLVPTKRSAYQPKKGDIVTTGYKTTASSGVIGHAGIFIDSSTILHISGSSTSKTSTLSWGRWKEIYKNKNMVFRVPNTRVATQAADWVARNYRGKSPGYKITSDWRSTSPTYCSKIVWQGYYFGTGSTPVMKKPVEPFIIQPRTIAQYFNQSYAPALVFSN